MKEVLLHLSHAFLVTVILYVFMKYMLRQSATTALTRSLLLGAVAFIYMVLFGHGFPTRMRRI